MSSKIALMTKLVSTDKAKIDEVLTRGVEQILPNKNGLAKLMQTRRIRLYLGIDPTGSLLTLGHSVVLRKLKQFADLGHEVILLIGSGTVKIGDPTGRDSTRPELSDAEIEANFKNWQEQASKVLDFEKIQIRYNGQWLDKMRLPDFIKLMAKTTVSQLLERDMFVKRMKKNLPIFTHELMYPLLQGYDSVAMDVDLEIGGTDQTFNMLMGRNLQRIYNQKEKWVLTTPIINGLDGRKMSKSYGNYIALTENHIDMYGKLMRLDDSQIVDYFTLLTDVPMLEIKKMAETIKDGANPMEFKKRLAFEITKMYHDDQKANQAAEVFERTIQQKQAPKELIEVQVENHSRLIDVCKLCVDDLSSSELKRLIKQSGVTLFPTEEKPTDINFKLNLDKVDTIRIGKRKWFRLVPK